MSESVERERESSCDREFGKIGLRFGNLVKIGSEF